MRHGQQINSFEPELIKFFSSELDQMAREREWNRDRQWTIGIHERLAAIGHRYGFKVFATRNQCLAADCPEWLYDHHWRVCGNGDTLIRIPLVVEIEFGFGPATIFERIVEDFFKLVQARADLRVMVFQCGDVNSMTDKLIEMAKNFEGTQQGDRWLFAGFDLNMLQMCCRPWSV